MCSSTNWGQNVKNRGQTTDHPDQWFHVNSTNNITNLATRTAFVDKFSHESECLSEEGQIYFFYKSRNKNSISISMWKYVNFRCTPDTPAQVAMWFRVAKPLHEQPVPTNSKDTLDLSVKSIIEKTVIGIEIYILTLETCVACICLYSLYFIVCSRQLTWHVDYS